MQHLMSLHINGMQIAYDDAQERVLINGRKLHLGHQKYLVARSLIAQYDQWKARQRDDRMVSLAALCQVTGTTSVRTLHRIVSDVRNTLEPFDLDIKSVRGDGYYLKVAETRSG